MEHTQGKGLGEGRGLDVSWVGRYKMRIQEMGGKAWTSMSKPGQQE